MSTDSYDTPDSAEMPPDSPQGTETESPIGASVEAPIEARDILRRWWAVLRRPGIATFDTVQVGASWPSIIVQTLLVGVVGAILAVIFVRTNVATLVIFNLLGAFLGLFVIVGLLFGAARLFGGKGRILPYAYVLTLIYVPLQLVGNVLGILPYVGSFVLIAIFLYLVLLSVYATASVHRLTLRRAGLAVLITFALLLVIGFVP